MLTVLGAVMAIIGGFQVPTMPHVLGIGVPVGILIAVVGNLVVGVGGAIGTGSRLGALGPALGWLIMTLFVLGQTQSSGSLIVPGTGDGQAFLFAGVAAAVAAITIGPLRWSGTGR